MTSIFDCGDVCAAVLTQGEKDAGVRFGQTLCDYCAEETAAANPTKFVQHGGEPTSSNHGSCDP